MQIAKKYFTEGLIQLTILLSLVGVRVDIDSYLSGYYTPLIDINLGPSSAYIQTPFHILRDGYGVHPKCPELDYFFASRRLLDEVRNLGSPRFPTQLSAWLVHQVSAVDKAECGPSTSNSTDTTTELESSGDEARDDCEHLPDSDQEVRQTTPEQEQEQGPCTTGAFLKQASVHHKAEQALLLIDMNLKKKSLAARMKTSSVVNKTANAITSYLAAPTHVIK